MKMGWMDEGMNEGWMDEGMNEGWVDESYGLVFSRSIRSAIDSG